MPNLRQHEHASPAEIERARKLRAKGWTVQLISAMIGRSEFWVVNHTKDVPPSPMYQRVKNLIRRGFDVPPSKQADFDGLNRKGYTLVEIKTILNLE